MTKDSVQTKMLRECRSLSTNIFSGALVASVAVLFSACSVDTISSKDVSTEAIHQNLSTSYSEESNSTFISAQFRVGGSTGTTVELEEPANLKLNGRTPARQNFLGTRYELTQPGFVPVATFEYKTKEDSTLINSIRIEPLSLVNAEATVSVNRPYIIDLQVPGFTGGDEVTVTMVQSVRKGESIQYLYAKGSFDSNQGKAFFYSSELSKMENGQAKVQISRTRSGRLSQGTRDGGFISATYNLRPIAVNIVEKSAGLYNPLAKN